MSYDNKMSGYGKMKKGKNVKSDGGGAAYGGKSAGPSDSGNKLSRSTNKGYTAHESKGAR